MADYEEQLAGVKANADGPCSHPACKREGQILTNERVTRYKDGWAHVIDMPGWDDEGGKTRRPAKKTTRKRAAKKSPAGPPDGAVDTDGAEMPAGDPDQRSCCDTRVNQYHRDDCPDGPSGDDSNIAQAIKAASAVTVSTALMSPEDADEWWAQDTPGLVPEMPEDVYHRDPWVGGSVSNSDAKLLLDSPAMYRYVKDNGRAPSRSQNLGSAAHVKVLGRGAKLVTIDADDYRTKLARETRDAAHAGGQIPLLKREAAVVDEMAKVLEQDPLAPMLFAHGRPEVSAFWIDPETGVARRARFDWLPDKIPGARLIVPDFKTTEKSLSPESFARASADFGYEMQDFTYTSGLAALGIDVDAAFVFVVQQVKPPYMVAVHQLDDDARMLGRHRTLRALRRHQYATETGDWFGWEGQIHDVELPRWTFSAEERDYARDSARYTARKWAPGE